MALPLVVDDLNVTEAPLPKVYEAAKMALANCEKIDECKDWSDKARALASYARQAEDDGLYKQALRIQARAIRRCGELLQQFKSVGGRPAETSDAPVTSFPSSQKEAAEQAGMSERQRVTAVRVANVPANDFEKAIEADKPATVTQLADWGRKPVERPMVHPKFHEANIVLMGHARRLAEFCRTNPASSIAPAVEEYNNRELRSCLAQVRRWMRQIAVELRNS